MNAFADKVCPYCKTKFKETDEIVVCSVCDMPHHRDCWVANQGCTTFGCMGAIKAPDGGPSAVTATSINYDETQNNIKYCPQCGSQNSSSNSFCIKCGNSFENRTFTPATTINVSNSENGISYSSTSNFNSGGSYRQQNYQSYNTSDSGNDSDIQLLIGQSSNYYSSKFIEMRVKNQKTSWNWCSFLFTPYWFIYRKMYGYGAAVLGGLFILSMFRNPLAYFLLLAVYIAFGIYGNYVYMITLNKKADQLKSIPEQYKAQFISEKGGTNTAAVVLSAVGFLILVSLINSL